MNIDDNSTRKQKIIPRHRISQEMLSGIKNTSSRVFAEIYQEILTMFQSTFSAWIILDILNHTFIGGFTKSWSFNKISFLNYTRFILKFLKGYLQAFFQYTIFILFQDLSRKTFWLFFKNYSSNFSIRIIKKLEVSQVIFDRLSLKIVQKNVFVIFGFFFFSNLPPFSEIAIMYQNRTSANHSKQTQIELLILNDVNL